MKCAICGGSRAEHFDETGKPLTQHVYTETAGDLKTPREEAQQALLGGTARVASQFRAPSSPQEPVLRMAQLLKAKGLLDDPDLLYVAGLGPLPSGYRDPNLFFGGGS